MSRARHPIAVLAALFAGAAPAAARDVVSIVGAAEATGFARQVAEAAGGPSAGTAVTATGAAEGFRAFCKGVGDGTPDAVAADRPMTEGEVKTCTGAGVTAIADLLFGADAVVLAAAAGSPISGLGRADVFTAAGAKVLVDGQLLENPYRSWHGVDGGLPDLAIRLIVPAPGSDAAAAFAETVLVPGCRSLPALSDLPPEAGEICARLRADGAVLEGPGGDGRALAVIGAAPGTLAVTTRSFVAGRPGQLAAVALDDVAPTAAAVADGRYGPTRRLHLYVKTAHRAVIPALEGFLAELASDRAIGPAGYLAAAGMVPPDAAGVTKLRAAVAADAPPPMAGR